MSPAPARPRLPAIFSGSGPGEQAGDGCSVEVYRALPYLGELDDILHLVPVGARVLELGSGPGRLARVLQARGCAVTAVDNSAAMLAHLPEGVRPVLADIDTLALAERFDVVLLPSGLVNHADPGLRAAFLCAAQRHLDATGELFVQRHDPTYLREAVVGSAAEVGTMRLELEAARREGATAALTIRYVLGTQCWRHSFVAEALEEAEVEQALRAAGCADFRWFGARRRWVGARLGPGAGRD